MVLCGMVLYGNIWYMVLVWLFEHVQARFGQGQGSIGRRHTGNTMMVITITMTVDRRCRCDGLRRSDRWCGEARIVIARPVVVSRTSLCTSLSSMVCGRVQPTAIATAIAILFVFQGG